MFSWSAVAEDMPGGADVYWPVVRGEVQELQVHMAAGRELLKREGACTTVVIARD